ncbi:hypothetical protein [Arthrobacter monumenti]
MIMRTGQAGRVSTGSGCDFDDPELLLERAEEERAALLELLLRDCVPV